MKKYLISIKDTDIGLTLMAKNELEARLKFCKKRGLVYRVYANKLAVKKYG